MERGNCSKCGAPILGVYDLAGRMIWLDERTPFWRVSFDDENAATAQRADGHVEHAEVCLGSLPAEVS